MDSDSTGSETRKSVASPKGCQASSNEKPDSPIKVAPSDSPPAAEPYRVSLNLLPEAALVFAPDGTILDANPSAFRLFEADTRDQIIGKRIYSFGQLAAQERADLIARIVAGKTIRFAFDFITFKGNHRCCEVLDIPLLTPAGAIDRVLGFGYDITDARRIENEKDLLAAIVESSDEAIVAISLDRRITAWNDAATRMFGFTAEETLGRPVIDTYLPPEMRDYGEKLISRLVERPGIVNRFELPCRRKNGTMIDVSMVAFGIRDRDGKLLGMAAIHSDVTKRKQSEGELAMLAAVVESSEDAIITKTPDYTIRTWNGGAERLYGYSATEVVGKPVTILMPPDHIDELDKLFGKVLRGEKVHQYETKRIRKDRTLVDVSLSESPVRDAAGKIVAVAAIERDIGERLRARELESQTIAIVKSAGVAIYSLGPGHIVRSWNAGAERLFGYRADEVLGRPSATMFPAVQAQLDEMQRRVLDFGETVEFESQRRRKDGVVLDVSVNASPILDAAGIPTGIAVITNDITARKRSERALADAQQQLQARLRQQAVVARLSQRAVGKMEPAALMEETVALTAETLGTDSCTILEFQPEAHAFMVSASVGQHRLQPGRTTVAAGRDSEAGYAFLSTEPVIVENYDAETRFRRDPVLAPQDAVSAVFIPILNQETSNGLIYAASKVFREFTNDDLNFIQTVAHIIAEALARKRFEQELAAARDEALESARAKSTFLANMSHEIRTPLNAIVGIIGLMRDTPLNSEQREFVENVLVSADALLSIINNVLDFSKVSAGKLNFETIEFEVRFVAETALDLVAESAQKKDLEVAVAIDDEVPKVLRGDPTRLRQVLVNLLANSVKFTDHGEVIVRIRLLSESERNATLRFEVSDTGIGVPEEVQKQLFQPFYQADSSTTRKYGGTGLGLAICAQIVERMGGHIGVESRPGDGSTFWFSVSLEKSAATFPVMVESPHELAKLRSLIIDDNATNREIIRHHLESWAMRVDEAASGAQALTMLQDAAENDPYAIAILDFLMPEMDGLDLANRIRTNPRISKTHLVMMSSAGSRKDYGAKAPAIEAWLTKPVKAAHLYRCLTSLPVHTNEGSLPRAAPIVPAAAAETVTPEGDSQRESGHKGRILLAEDNPINQRVALMQLRRLGYMADGVGNGIEALAALAQVPYDAVLMDCQMPEMDGYEATRQLRQRERDTHHTIVIALTAFGLSGDREKCLDAGMDDYLAKPVRKEDLEQLLERWLPRRPKVAASSTVDRNVAESPVVFDSKIFNDLRSEGDEFFIELVDMFITDVPTQLDGLAQALDQGDSALASRLAHTLKGTAATFGATQMQQQAATIDQASRANSLPEARALLGQFRAECARVRAALQAELAKLSGNSPAHKE